jgi:hypothetical protein
MRDYAKVSPKFWAGETGQQLAARGSEALLVALYLMTSPHSNMLGLYHQPVLYMAEETGMTPEGALKGLQHCIEEGFCAYDSATKMVWVYEMASYQIGSSLEPKDNRVKGIQRDYAALPNNPFLAHFFDRYAAAFHMTERREFVVKNTRFSPSLGLPFERGLEAPSKQGTGAGAGTGATLQAATAALSAAMQPTATPAPSPGPTPAPTPAPTQPPLVLDGDTKPDLPPCPVKQLVALFAMKCPELPKPRYEMWKDGPGAEAMRHRWKWLLGPEAVREDKTRYASSAAEAIDWFGRFFDTVHESDFLSGRSGSWGKCDLAWLMKRENFIKVVQGNYTNKANA